MSNRSGKSSPQTTPPVQHRQPAAQSFASVAAAGAKMAAQPNGGAGSPPVTDKQRYQFIAALLIGSPVSVTLKDGAKWEGVLHSVEGGIVLHMASNIFNPKATDGPYPRPLNEFHVPAEEFASLDVHNVRVDSSTIHSRTSDLRTDTEISSGQAGKERKLQSWVLDDGADLEELGHSSDGAKDWDQFEVNRSKFQVQSTYSESFYTTDLDRESADYRSREAEAARIAREIETEVTDDIHLAEERGQKTEDEVDEEDRYSTVLRDPSASGRYVPPGKRKQALVQSRDSEGELSPLRKGSEMSNSAENLPEFTGVSSDSKPRRNSRGLLGQPPRSPKLSPTLSKFNVDSSAGRQNDQQRAQFHAYLNASGDSPGREKKAEIEDLKQFSEQLKKNSKEKSSSSKSSPKEGEKKESSGGGLSFDSLANVTDAQEFKPGMATIMAMLGAGAGTPLAASSSSSSSGPQIVSSSSPAPQPLSPQASPKQQHAPVYASSAPYVPQYSYQSAPMASNGPTPSAFLDRPVSIVDTRSISNLYGSRMKNKATSVQGRPGAKREAGGGSETWTDVSISKRRSYKDPIPPPPISSPPSVPQSPPQGYYPQQGYYDQTYGYAQPQSQYQQAWGYGNPGYGYNAGQQGYYPPQAYSSPPAAQSYAGYAKRPQGYSGYPPSSPPQVYYQQYPQQGYQGGYVPPQ